MGEEEQNDTPSPELTPVDAEIEVADQELLPEPALPEEQYCIFRAGRERFCLHVLEVDEVVEWPRLTRLPLSPPYLMGVFNLRGTIVPVVDIAFTEVRRGDLPPKQVVVACLRGGTGGVDVQVGIAVDEVIGTYSTSEPLLKDEAPRDVPHCAGMLRHGEKLALALDLRRVLESFPVGVI
jgi:purine-binding chemotaxis protein CheW